ncbi:MAG TPA: lysophospholipid acyltransferase family protein [Aggregatilineales bacterium]|nr:lysophospholipid acyltransferase family protein [Aggregatilineales bacterium]
MSETIIPPKNMFLVRFIAFTFGIIFRLYFRMRYKLGMDFGKKDRPAIIVFNHTSHLDPLLIALCLGVKYAKDIVPFGKKELFQGGLMTWIVRGLGGFPVDRDTLDVSAARAIMTILKEGGTILLAPEGTRSLTGEVQPFNNGFIKMAMKAKALILPVGIKGAYEALPKGVSIPRPYKIAVNFGDFIDLSSQPRSADIDALAEAVRQTIIRLKG